jgi:RNA polymerase sigma-70 factor (ECF subfamily)
MMSDHKLLDAELMKRVAAGDQSACRSLVEAHVHGLVGLAYRMLHDMAAAEDIAQENFLKLWRMANRWKPEARVSTWLYRVAHNLAINEIRRRGHLSDQEAPDTADPAASQYIQQHQSQVRDQVEAALAHSLLIGCSAMKGEGVVFGGLCTTPRPPKNWVKHTKAW